MLFRVFGQALINNPKVYPIVIAKDNNRIKNMLVIVETRSIESPISRIKLPEGFLEQYYHSIHI